MGGRARGGGRVGEGWQSPAGLEGRERVFLSSEGWRGDKGAPAYFASEITLLDEALVGARHCLWGDAQGIRETPDWG
jgi:hypothetical protein